MDMFDRVANNVAGANIRTIGATPNYNQRQASRDPRFATNGNRSPQPLEIMSDDALKSLDSTLQKKFQMARDARTRNMIQNQLYAVQDESNRRQAIVDNKPIDVIPAKEKDRISGIGTVVGTSALIFGVLGFLIGATTSKPKLAIVWGVGGATLGGLGAFFMAQEDSGVRVARQ